MFNPNVFQEKIYNVRFPVLKSKNEEGEEVEIIGIVVIKSPPDGSCLFHSVLKAFSKKYNQRLDPDRKAMVTNVRKDLAEALGEMVPHQEGDLVKKTYYEILSNGNLASFGVHSKEFSLPYLQELLKSNNSVGMEFIEALGLFFDIDIYIIDMLRSDLYFIGTDLSIYYKGRKSIVLGYTQASMKDDGHYDVIGLNIGNKIYTLFEKDNFFIRSLNDRYKELKTKIKQVSDILPEPL